MKRNVLLIPHLCLYSKKDFQQDVGHSSDLGQKQSGTPLTKKDQGENWDRVPELMMIKFRESGHPVFRATSPFSRGMLTSTGGGKLSIHFCADGDTIETVFRTIISVNQLSIYGAVSELSEEYGTCRTRTGTCCVRAIWSTFRASRLIDNDTHTVYWNSRTRKFFAEAQRTSGKASTTRVGQYFMT